MQRQQQREEEVTAAIDIDLASRTLKDEDDVAVVEQAGDLRIVRTADDLEEVSPLEIEAGEPSHVARNYRRIGWGLVATDALMLAISLLVVALVRPELSLLGSAFPATLIASTLLWVGIFYASGLYAPHHLSAPEEFRRLIGAVSVGVVVVTLVSFSTATSNSSLSIGLVWLSALVLEMSGRNLWHKYMHRMRKDGRLAMRTIIVGTNDEALRLAEELTDPVHGTTPLGVVAVARNASVPNDLPVVGRVDNLADVIEALKVDCVFVASSAVGSHHMVEIVQAARRGGAQVRVSANLPEIMASRLTVQPVGAAMMLSLKPVRLSGLQATLKRAFDLVAATGLLLFTSPLWIAAAVATRCTSRGPVLFRQERVTQHGETFTMLKFRTMVVDGDCLLEEHNVDKASLFFKVEDDPRITGVGRWLRSLSIDELPQLVNVIKGDMSLVGPRPLPLDQVEANRDLLAPRQEVRAGVTGWWQVKGRSELDPKAAVRLDLFYIENWSLAFDLYVLLKTAGAVIARRGAY